MNPAVALISKSSFKAYPAPRLFKKGLEMVKQTDNKPF